MIAAPTLPWIVRALPRLDAEEETDQLDALRQIRRMMADARLSFATIAGMIPLRQPPHLEPGAPVNLETVGKMLEADYDRVPLRHLPTLGALQQRLKAGHRPTTEEVKHVQRVRREVAAGTMS